MSVGTVLSYPIPAYSNVPIEPQFYQPSRFVISQIILGINTIVTTSINHNYVIGQLVRLIIPPNAGCRNLNESQGYVLSIPSPTQVLLSINSTDTDPFIVPSASSTQAQTLAIGEINSGQTNSNGTVNQVTYIPGSFINISPN